MTRGLLQREKVENPALCGGAQ